MTLSGKVFVGLILGGVSWLLFIFYISPRQAWIDGLIEAYFMSSGLVIYKDFVTQYFPILYLSMLPFHDIFGFTLKPTIALALVSSITAFLLLSFISYKLLKGWFRLIPLLFFLFWDPVLSENHFGTTSFQNILLLSAFALWWVWYQRPKMIPAFLIGLLLGIASMSGHIVLINSTVVFLSMIFRSWQIKKIKSIIYFGLGFLIPVAFVFVYLLTHNVLGDFYNWTIKYYLSDSGYPFAMGRGVENVVIFLTIFSPLLLVGAIIWFKVKKVKQSFFALQKKGLTLSLTQSIFWWLILLSFPLPFWFAIFHPNRFLTPEGIYALTAGLALQMLFKIKKNQLTKVLIICLIMLFAFSFYIVLPKYQRNFSYPRPYLNLTRIYPEDPLFDIISWIKQNTTKEDKLFATVDSLIYLETNRLPANPRASTNLPVFYRPLERLVEELKQNPPDFWVIDERQWKRFADFGYQAETTVLKRILKCEPVVFQSDYITIKKHIFSQQLCL
ncbi:MAG: hypothetical protein UU73_C0001G0143 [Candidatus Daviesbacteria bacterium GW2011_GWA1_41_61]|uniref:Glycosyltransferase RgtA/B/C/D-like domain-containing protein n=1 Tax=Candidatus Daviesbacteria bacterium GW2011_GWA2_40_9 TaxID=1618424 RepID=A0A0G0X5W6_9BACT|nr:MAG: hypothetical protein UU26_C0001G0022 [Candidatus Daviesbacteria bacterium GW2011_GWC1_40_9]KKR83037.1 MAG: hypothetical protein UU29_C0008G0146 [Candidatus Daviesbacteria bacterium GW2011_GWA2_40_9]KKR92962.1 MAG: hypothetical protein UU44_C0004G0144 [Candidatus Daviesbacteria bacterium GW2011_GWB1_41_15]KKS15506.1 MAG: hypothetical protein UU73_C0001G0143 [Candidatus Daviesbacteria bacterium GW2011_GWA1_41_61]